MTKKVAGALGFEDGELSSTVPMHYGTDTTTTKTERHDTWDL